MGLFDEYQNETVRDAFGKAMCELGNLDDKVVLISADSQGASKTTEFHKSFSNRSFNVGIAEQNMVSFAVGMALEGYKPYVSTRAPFISMRAAEQVRTAACYDNLPIVFIGTGAGYCSGTAGATHWALEDVAIMSSFGNMTVFETGDAVLIRKIIKKTLDWNKPAYIRLAKDTEDVLYTANCEIELGKSNELRGGLDGYFIVSGATVNYACKAAQKLEIEYGLSIGVIDMFTIKPIDKEAIIKATKTGNVIVAQDHNVIGGLGSLVSQVIAENRLSCNYEVLGCPDYFVPVASSGYLYHKFGYDEVGLVSKMKNLCGVDK